MPVITEHTYYKLFEQCLSIIQNPSGTQDSVEKLKEILGIYPDVVKLTTLNGNYNLLHIAYYFTDNRSLIEYLINSGINEKYVNKQGFTPQELLNYTKTNNRSAKKLKKILPPSLDSSRLQQSLEETIKTTSHEFSIKIQSLIFDDFSKKIRNVTKDYQSLIQDQIKYALSEAAKSIDQKHKFINFLVSNFEELLGDAKISFIGYSSYTGMYRIFYENSSPSKSLFNCVNRRSISGEDGFKIEKVLLKYLQDKYLQAQNILDKLADQILIGDLEFYPVKDSEISSEELESFDQSIEIKNPKDPDFPPTLPESNDCSPAGALSGEGQEL